MDEKRLGLLTTTPFGWAVERYLAAATTALVVGSLYFAIGRATRAEHYELHSGLDELIPFIPETVWIYFPLYVGIFHVGTFFITDREVFYRAMGSLALAGLLCTVGFLLVPSTMPVPRLEDDGTVTTRFLLWVQSIDVPNNTFPSQHVACSFACAFGGWVHNRRLGAVLLLMATLIAVSTATTKQHYGVDAPGGLAMAAVAHYLVFRVRRAPEPHRQASQEASGG